MHSRLAFQSEVIAVLHMLAEEKEVNKSQDRLQYHDCVFFLENHPDFEWD